MQHSVMMHDEDWMVDSRCQTNHGVIITNGHRKILPFRMRQSGNPSDQKLELRGYRPTEAAFGSNNIWTEAPLLEGLKQLKNLFLEAS